MSLGEGQTAGQGPDGPESDERKYDVTVRLVLYPSRLLGTEVVDSLRETLASAIEKHPQGRQIVGIVVDEQIATLDTLQQLRGADLGERVEVVALGIAPRITILPDGAREYIIGKMQRGEYVRDEDLDEYRLTPQQLEYFHRTYASALVEGERQAPTSDDEGRSVAVAAARKEFRAGFVERDETTQATLSQMHDAESELEGRVYYKSLDIQQDFDRVRRIAGMRGRFWEETENLALERIREIFEETLRNPHGTTTQIVLVLGSTYAHSQLLSQIKTLLTGLDPEARQDAVSVNMPQALQEISFAQELARRMVDPQAYATAHGIALREGLTQEEIARAVISDEDAARALLSYRLLALLEDRPDEDGRFGPDATEKIIHATNVIVQILSREEIERVLLSPGRPSPSRRRGAIDLSALRDWSMDNHALPRRLEDALHIEKRRQRIDSLRVQYGVAKRLAQRGDAGAQQQLYERQQREAERDYHQEQAQFNALVDAFGFLFRDLHEERVLDLE